MNIRSTTYLCFALLIIISCNNNVQKEAKNNEATAVSSDGVNTPDSLSKMAHESAISDDFNGANCSEYSNVMQQFVDLLITDNYEIQLISDQPEVTFVRESSNMKPEQVISFDKSQCNTVVVKRKHPIENQSGEYYPSFAITEICINDESLTVEAFNTITKVLESNDPLNDKNYDYIVKNNTRLVYVSCNAKIFEEYAFSYKSKIEELVKKDL